MADSNAEGAYRLRVRHPGPYLIVAAAAPPWVAAGKQVSAVLGQRVDVDPLVMEEGVTIRGRVRFRGDALPEAKVGARPTLEGMIDLQIERARVCWHEGRVFSGETVADADATGTFEVSGLSRVLHRVWVEDAPGFSVHMDAERASERMVEAPASGVSLDLQGCVVTVAVVRDGSPVPEPTLMLSGQGGGVVVTADESGESRILLPAGSKVRAILFGPAPLSGSSDIEVPADRHEHREVIDVGGEGAGAALVVTLEGPGEEQVKHAGFALLASASAQWPSDTRDLQREGGRFELTGLRPGPLVVRVRPGGPYWGGHGFHLEQALEIEIPEEGEVAARVPLRPAGRIRIAARAPDGGFVGATCSIRDENSNEVAGGYVTRTASGLAVSYGALGDDSISSVDPPLAPGRYQIRIEHDAYLTKVVDVEVKSGESVDVDVTLERRR